MSIVTAAVVGVVLNLTIYLGLAVIFPNGFALQQLNYFAIVWTFLSFIALNRFQISMISWIGVSALAGLLVYFMQ